MLERAQHVQHMCSLYRDKLAASNPDPELSFFVSDTLQIAFCLLHKCSSSTLKRVISSAIVGETVTNGSMFRKFRRKGQLRRLDIYEDQADVALHGYTKLLFIRNPFDRLVSAFNYLVKRTDKFGPSFDPQNPGRKDDMYKYAIRERYGLNFSHDAEFWMFADFMTSNSSYAVHKYWQVIGRWCEPCKVRYDMILRIETASRDYGILLNHLNLSADIISNTTSNVNHRNKLQFAAKQPVNVVDPKVLLDFKDVDRDLVLKLYDMYRYDFYMGGYHFDQNSLEASCSIKTKSGELCC